MALSPELREKASMIGKELASDGLCVVAGAGICRDPPAGLPDWCGLVSQLNELHDTGLDAATLGKPLQAMTVIERRLDPDRSNARRKLVQAIKALLPPSARPTRVHRLLLKLGCPLYTTNVDDLFEKAARSVKVPVWVVHRNEDVSSVGTGVPLFKLHGDLSASAPKELVLTEADYLDVVCGKRRQAVFDLFRADLERRHVLFIGHSGTDLDLVSVWQYVRELLGEAAREAWLLTAGESIDTHDLAESRGYQIIRLGSYRDLLAFLRQVSREGVPRTKPTVCPPAPPHSTATVEVIEEVWRDEAERIGKLFEQGSFVAALKSAKRWEQRIAGATGMPDAVASQIHRIEAICHRELLNLDKAQREIEVALKVEPHNTKNRMEQAQISLALGDESLARDCLRGVKGIDARRMRAEIAFRADNLAPVQRLLRAKQALADPNCQALFAHYYLTRGLFQEAVSTAEKAAELAPGPRGLEFAGDIHFAVGTSAIGEALQERLLLPSDTAELPMDGLANAEAIRSAVNLYRRAGDALPEKSGEPLRRVLGKICQGAHLIGDTVMLNSTQVDLPPSLEQLTKARHEASDGAVGSCVQEISRACWDVASRAQSLLNAARVLIAVNQPARAVRVLDAIVDHIPEEYAASYHWHKANALLRAQGLDAALSAIPAVKRTQHGMAAVWLYRARLYASVGRNSNALRWFRKALESRELRISALYYAARFMGGGKQDHAEAAELLSELIQLLPSVRIREEFARQALLCGDETWFRRGFSELRQMRRDGIKSQAVLQGLVSCHQAEKNWQEARQVAEEYLKVWPDDLAMRSNYALFLAQSREFGHALAELERVTLQAPPEQAELLLGVVVNKAQILLEAERYEAGYDAAKLACDQFPKRPEPWLALLRACQLAGRETELGAAAAEFHRRFPDHQAVEERRGARMLVKLMRRWDQHAAEARLAYLSGKIPIHVLAEAVNLPLTVVWTGFSKSERIVYGMYTPPNVDAEAARIGETQGIVLDYTALLAIDALRLWDLIGHLPPLVVSSGLAERLRDDQHRLHGRRRPQHRERCEAIRLAITQASGARICDRFPQEAIPQSSLDRHGLSAAADLWEAQAEAGVVLDDLSKTLPPACCLRISQLLDFMRDKGWITLSVHSDCMQELSRWPGCIKANTQAALAWTAEAITTPIVISRTSLESLQQLGILPEVVRRCRRLVVSKPTWNYLLSELAQLDFASDAAARHKRIRQHVVDLPCEDVSGTQVREAGLRDLKGMEAPKQNWCLVRGRPRLLWTDDAFCRILTEGMQELQGAEAITTLSVLRWLKEEGHLADEVYHRAVCQLVCLRYEYIVLEEETLRWAMQEHNWRPSEQLGEILRYFSRLLETFRPTLPPVDHFLGAFNALLDGLWQQRHLSFQEKLQVADWFCGAILPPKLTANLRTPFTESLVQLMLASMMKLSPHVARPFAVWLTGYVRRQGVSAADLSRMLRRHYDLEGTGNVSLQVREAWQRASLLRLPVFLRALILARSRVTRKAAAHVQLGMWEVQTPAVAFKIADPDLTMLAEREVAFRGRSAIGKRGTVETTLRPAQVAMTTEENGEPRWASVPEELEATVDVPVSQLLECGDPRVRALAVRSTAHQIARSGSGLADRAKDLLAEARTSDEMAPDVSELLQSPAVRLAVLHGGSLTRAWSDEFASLKLRPVHRCYQALLAARVPTALHDVDCWSYALHELAPRQGYFGRAAKRISRSKRGQLLRLLIRTLQTTNDPFAFGGALEAICEVTSRGKSLGPRQLLAVREAVNSALTGFADDKTRRGRLVAFAETLRASSWVVAGRAGDGTKGKTREELRSRERLGLILPVARDIVQVLRLRHAGRTRAASIAQFFSNFANERVVAALQDGGTPPLRDAADHRCVDCLSLISAVITDTLLRNATFARRLVDADTAKGLMAYLSVVLSPRSQPKRTTNRLNVFPSQVVAPIARELLFRVLPSQKQRRRLKAPRIAQWPSIGPKVAVLQPELRDMALGDLCSRLPFMPADAVGKTYQAIGGAGCAWDSAEEGRHTALQFCWLAFPLLGRKQRTELAEATGSGLEAALDCRNANLALFVCSCVGSVVAKLRKAEWMRLSAAILRAVGSDALDESARRRLAGLVLGLPSAVGRLNRELAAQAAFDAFPDLRTHENARV